MRKPPRKAVRDEPLRRSACRRLARPGAMKAPARQRKIPGRSLLWPKQEPTFSISSCLFPQLGGQTGQSPSPHLPLTLPEEETSAKDTAHTAVVTLGSSSRSAERR